MNHIYRLIWSKLYQIWIVVGELSRAHKKTATVTIAIALSGILLNAHAASGTQNIPLSGDGKDYKLQKISDIDGIHSIELGKDGTDGEAAYIFQTSNSTKPEDNPISVDKNTVITGGHGGYGYYGNNGGNGNVAIKGDYLKIENHGSISGGSGGSGGGNGGNGGNGNEAISGNHLIIINNEESEIFGGLGNHGGHGGYGNYISDAGHGGHGGVAINGNDSDISNKGTILGGHGGIGGIGGTGGSSINNYHIGAGADGGQGGKGINGNRITINNQGMIIGGNGGNGGDSGSNFDVNDSWNNIKTNYGGNGGKGGAAINGDYLSINNLEGKIQGGDGGASGYSRTGSNGSVGGAAINGDHLKIDNLATIQGGKGGNGCSDGSHGVAGNGGAAIYGNDITIDNKGIIEAGEGGYGGLDSDGGHGGTAISGNNLIINNTNGTIQGGSGSAGCSNDYRGNYCNNGNGGAAITGNDITINNTGYINGGSGANSGLIESKVGNGATAIDGNFLKINNDIDGVIKGGKAGYAGNNGRGSVNGEAINGGNLTITNSGQIIKGEKLQTIDDDNSIIVSEEGVAISLQTGKNSLTLKTGSYIQGDIMLAAGKENFLQIISEINRTIEGNLKANDNTNVILSGKQISFSKNTVFGNQTNLTFVNGSSLHADKIIFNHTNIDTHITDWDQNDIILAEATNGISGQYDFNSKNYAEVMLNDQKNKLIYTLSWNNLNGNSHGTFSVKGGEDLNLNVNLTDKRPTQNWDGKSLTKDGSGMLQLSAKNNYTGVTNLHQGTLKLGVDNAIANTSELIIASTSNLNLGGHNQTIKKIDNRGTILINDLGRAPLIKEVIVKGDMQMHKGGILILNNCKNCAEQTYVQKGNWVGDGGTVQLGTVLNGDNSKTDKLQITGTATGTTKVKVVNEGGKGAETLEGIELITTSHSDKDAFVQDGRIAAGSHDYYLQQGNAYGKKMNNWYLTSNLGDNQETRVFRPEAGSYASNLAADNTLFNLQLQDRQHSDWYTDITNEENGHSSTWLRIVQGHNKNTMSDQQSKTTSNRTVFQIGGDILTGAFSTQDQLYIGLLGGYGRQTSHTHNHFSGYSSQGKVQGYSAGLYGTWYQNRQQSTGAYVDSWVMYNWFHNTVQGDQLAKEKYYSQGITASLETGYEYKAVSYQTSSHIQNELYIRPQAQIQWLNVKAKDHTEDNGTHVYGKGNGNIQTRLGLHLSLVRYYANKASAIRFKPYAELNWLHNTKQYGVNMGDTTTNVRGNNNMAEIKLGLEARIKGHLHVWGNVSHQLGQHQQRDTQGIAGIKYMF